MPISAFWPGPKAAALALVAIATAAGAVDARAAGPFGQLDGTWTGSGRINLEDGKSESLKCRAYYTPKANGAEMGLALRCASASSKVELRANLVSAGNQISGNWEERNFNASGTVAGEASPNQIKLGISGGGFSGSMAVTINGASQAISVSTQGVALKGVSVSLRRD